MDQRKSIRKTSFSNNDHKLLSYGSEKHVFGSLFPGGSAFGAVGQKILKKGGRSYQRKSDQKNSYRSSDTKASPGRMDAK